MTATRQFETLTLSDGRPLTYAVFGDPSGNPLIALHGTPGSRAKFKSADAIAKVIGIKLICPDRWAYAGSEPPNIPSLSAYANDIRQLVDVLGIRQFSVLGVSGGGPFAAAIASQLPDRITKLGLFAPVGPIAGSLTFPSAIAPQYAFHKFCFGTLTRWPGLVRSIFAAYRVALTFSPKFAIAIATARAPQADKRIVKQELKRDALADAFQIGLSQSANGPAIDLSLFGKPWDISINRANMPTKMWLGTSDRNVPQRPAHALATQLPRCTLTEIPGAGHFWILENEDTVLEWFADGSPNANQTDT